MSIAFALTPIQGGVILLALAAAAGVLIWRFRPAGGKTLYTTGSTGWLPPTTTPPPSPPPAPPSVSFPESFRRPYSDSDRTAPPGAKLWIGEILDALDGAPDALKLELLQADGTTVATARKRFIEYLKQPATTPTQP